MDEDIKNVAPTISVDFLRKDIRKGSQIFSLQLWDTAGQEKFDAITKLHFMDANVIVIVIDITQRDQMISQCEHWHVKLKENCRPDASKFPDLRSPGAELTPHFPPWTLFLGVCLEFIDLQKYGEI